MAWNNFNGNYEFNYKLMPTVKPEVILSLYFSLTLSLFILLDRVHLEPEFQSTFFMNSNHFALD